MSVNVLDLSYIYLSSIFTISQKDVMPVVMERWNGMERPRARPQSAFLLGCHHAYNIVPIKLCSYSYV